MNTTILEPYKILVQFLGEALGPDYEIVLQDLTSDQNAIVAIANGQISGRSIGSPLTDAALQMLSSRLYEKNDFLCNYKGITEAGLTLRSSTMFIKDETGTPVGLLCINFDGSRFTELSQKLLSLIQPDGFETAGGAPRKALTPAGASKGVPEAASNVTETFLMDISSLMQKIFGDCTAGLATPTDRLNQQERKDIVAKLNDQGLFQLKGSIPFVARKFACSTATIYRYLSEITN